MSMPKDKLHQLIEDLDDKDAENLIDITEALIIKRKTLTNTTQTQEFDPEEFRGILKHLNIDVEKESRELRNQWKRDIC
jgi:hypothetical protein